jgi:predicted membrane chloride channel (bestrophin family)
MYPVQMLLLWQGDSSGIFHRKVLFVLLSLNIISSSWHKTKVIINFSKTIFQYLLVPTSSLGIMNVFRRGLT